ncbi:hypothetical protein Afil01_25440 [Actinorhabdospora filicis]|uniref:Uncharacterized protein n=1 Tax=Actinorhabdospora filicis TaxID=1785913 RepID=A0A9W6W349_9ACTN|nr:hypothetical protein [Actinorhabdospora filicis]GLZ77737.1 hypothetical protein Afil01_25440 [Actinorhabdospora filicis]
MNNADLQVFSAHVQRRRRQIIADVADAQRGGDPSAIEDELRRRLRGTGVSDAELAAWARDIGALPQGS